MWSPDQGGAQKSVFYQGLLLILLHIEFKCYIGHIYIYIYMCAYEGL